MIQAQQTTVNISQFFYVQNYNIVIILFLLEDDEIKERISSTVENVVVNEPNAVLCEPGSNPESTNTNSDNFTSVQNQDVCEIEELCISYPSVSSSAGSISESASITDQTKEAMPNQVYINSET